MTIKQIKTKWIKALRSREYKQCIGHFNNGEGRYCAVGVLVDCAGTDAYHDVAIKTLTKDGTSVLTRVIEKNDLKKQKFYQIARWLERNL